MNPPLFQQVQTRLRGLSGRSRAVGLFFGTSLAARVVGISCQLIQVPIAMSVLGTEAFGLWMTLTGIGYMITFADFGLGQGAQNKLAEAFAAGDDARARELWSATLACFGLIGAVLAVAAVGVAERIDPAALFNLVDPAVRAQAPAAVAVTLLLFCLNFPLGLAQRLAYSRQQGWMHNISLAAGGVGALGGIVLAAHRHWGLPGIIAATLVPLLLANAVLLVIQLAQLGWLDFRLPRCRRATLRELFGLGAYFGVQQLQLIIMLALPQVVISTTLGAAAVTPYNLAQRLFNLFAVIQNAFMLPLWPAYSDALAKGEFAWIRRTLFRSLAATLLLTLAPMALGAAFARPVLTAWIGASHAADLPSTALIWLLFLWNALVFVQQPFGYLLAGMSEVRRVTFYAVVSTAASSVLMFLLAHRRGPEGVVLGMAVGYLPFLLLGNVAETVRVFRAMPDRRAAEPALIPSPSIAEGRP
ncbi:MAG TPA: lipopolysaccharide biosynthesis protein [Opitutaceae bacterium]|nr:lipopolysaccharide biosynthesis protein [Opitutaceae bacterium]